jgi:hypothetical protein
VHQHVDKAAVHRLRKRKFVESRRPSFATVFVVFVFFLVFILVIAVVVVDVIVSRGGIVLGGVGVVAVAVGDGVLLVVAILAVVVNCPTSCALVELRDEAGHSDDRSITVQRRAVLQPQAACAEVLLDAEGQVDDHTQNCGTPGRDVLEQQQEIPKKNIKKEFKI